MSLTVSAAEWDQWEAERVERAQTARERNAWQTRRPKSNDHLVDRIIGLETQLYLRTVMLESALELLNKRAVELASLRTLIRMDVALKAMDRETATPRLEMAA